MSHVTHRPSFAPPSTLRLGDHLPLGARVAWTHRAAVARWKPSDHPTPEWAGEWLLVEGVSGSWRPALGDLTDDEAASAEIGLHDDPFYRRRPRSIDPNKTVFVWPENGEGFLFGYVRRGVGRSYSSTGSTSMFEDNYEPGGFSADGYVNLYAVKSQLPGVSYLLAPFWAVRTLG